MTPQQSTPRRGAIRWLALTLFASALAVTAPAALAQKLGDAVTLPSLRLADGTVLDATALRGPVLIYVWASWCPFCARQTPYYQKLYEQLRASRSSLRMVSVSIDTRPEDAIRYMNERGYTFPVSFDAAALSQALGSRPGLPRVYVIDRAGRLAVAEAGELFEEDVAAFARFGMPSG
ncbi:MAG TPA: TlpA disulfide reductase family protein, partial [Burkholderiaceae bacterium]|nr:TlpA disulfide reductase family protein [Burkholderiaceae bacterium]